MSSAATIFYSIAVYTGVETAYGLLVQETTYMHHHRDNFQQVYRDARSMRGVLRNEFVTAGAVEVFVSDTSRVVVGRTGDYGARPGFYAACLSSGHPTKAARRYFVERSREHDKVPLPR